MVTLRLVVRIVKSDVSYRIAGRRAGRLFALSLQIELPSRGWRPTGSCKTQGQGTARRSQYPKRRCLALPDLSQYGFLFAKTSLSSWGRDCRDPASTASSVAWYYFHRIVATYGILFGTAMIDVVLYLVMGNVLECYRCHAQYRWLTVAGGIMKVSTLETHERYRQQASRLHTSTHAAHVRVDVAIAEHRTRAPRNSPVIRPLINLEARVGMDPERERVQADLRGLLEGEVIAKMPSCRCTPAMPASSRSSRWAWSVRAVRRTW